MRVKVCVQMDGVCCHSTHGFLMHESSAGMSPRADPPIKDSTPDLPVHFAAGQARDPGHLRGWGRRRSCLSLRPPQRAAVKDISSSPGVPDI